MSYPAHNVTADPVPLISAAQDLTANWANLGSAIPVEGCEAIAVYLTVDINNSVNVQLQALAYHTSGGTAHQLPIRTVGASKVALEAEYFEFNVDADQSMVVPISLDKNVRFLQLQVKAGTVGTPTAGQIDAAAYLTR